MADYYSHLSRAQLAYEYLHTNSTTHEFLFGALAEMIDNSRDANATTAKIYTVPQDNVRGDVLLHFLDDGCGMDPVEVSQVIQFGRSMKRQTGGDQIGQYGNGLKSGSMRIGKDMLLFTKRSGFLSSLFLSRTFHERENIHEVIVPLPSWQADTKKPNVKSKEEHLKHDIEVGIITKYSPFKSEAELLKQYENITSETGTLIIIFNLKLMDNGDPELDVLTDPDDIKMADPHSDEIYDIDENVLPEKVSFRAYTSVLYSEPRMKIYIQHKKVRTRRLVNCLYKPRQYLYASTRFKRRSEQEVEQAEHSAKMAEELAKELATQAKETMARGDYTSRDSRSETQLAANKVQEAKMNAEVKRKIANEKRKSLKEPKQLTFAFGFNVDKRTCDGMFIYNCNRLIRMYEKVGPQLEGGVKCAGLVGVVDVPYLVLEPTHNKQDFADAKEYKHLLKSMADHMLQYWKDCKIESQGVVRFWEDFGYLGRWKDPPSDEPKFTMKRAMSIPTHVQCDICLRWRQLQFSRRNPSMEVPDDWVCAMNTDPSFQSCSKPEQKFSIPVGKMVKEIKNVQEKAAEDAAKFRERLKKAEKKLGKVNSYEMTASPASPVDSQPTRNWRERTSRSPSPPPKNKVIKREPVRKEPPKKEPVRREPPKKEPVRKDPPRKEPPRKEMVRREPAKNESPIKEAPLAKKRTPSAPAVKRKYVEESPRKNERDRLVKRKTVEPAEESSPAKKSKEVPENQNQVDKSDTRKQKDDVTSTTKPKQLDSEPKKDTAEDESSISALYQIGSRVESKVHDRWYTGRVNAIKSGTSNIPVKVKVKFDQHSQDKFDKWFEESDPNLRLVEDANSTTPLNSKLSVPSPSPVSPKSAESPSTTTNELQSTGLASPITTTAPADSMFANLQDEYTKQQDVLDALASKFRSCLHFFCPPDFHLNKEAIMQMKPADLREFPVSKFIKDYERNIKQHVRQHELRAKDAEMRCTNITKEKDAQADKVKSLEKQLAKEREVLHRLRADVSVMVRNLLQGGAQLDPDDNSEQVDSYLHAIVSEISDQS